MDRCEPDCREFETRFLRAEREEMESVGLSEKLQIESSVPVEFKFLEMEFGKEIRNCVEKFGVEKQWILTKNYSKANQGICRNKSLEFLTDTEYQDCSYKWLRKALVDMISILKMAFLKPLLFMFYFRTFPTVWKQGLFSIENVWTILILWI